MYSYLSIGVFRYKYLMSHVMNLASSVETTLLKRSLVVVMLVVGVQTSPG